MYVYFILISFDKTSNNSLHGTVRILLFLGAKVLIMEYDTDHECTGGVRYG